MTRDPLAGYDPSEPLDFVQHGPHGAGGTVHVVSRAGQAVKGTTPASDPGAPDVLGFALMRVHTVCGVNINTAPGLEPGGNRVGAFPDDLFCARCWKSLGLVRAVRAFEHPKGDEA